MGNGWDAFVPPPTLWQQTLGVLKPGVYGVVFASPRTLDWMSLSLRLARFEVRDTLMWVYGSGMPKSMNASKAIDRKLGLERKVVGVAADFARDGWDTALKPAWEPIILVRKPLDGTVAENLRSEEHTSELQSH